MSLLAASGHMGPPGNSWGRLHAQRLLALFGNVTALKGLHVSREGEAADLKRRAHRIAPGHPRVLHLQ